MTEAAPSPSLFFLGTGGASATEKRDNTSLLIEYGRDLFLIDCPGCIIPKIKSLSLNPRKIASLFITHTHPDHIYGFPSLVHSMMQENITLQVYGSAESLEFARRLLDIFGLLREKIQYRIEFNPLSPNEEFQPLTDTRALSQQVRHKSSSLGIYMDFPEEKTDLLYTGDTAVHPPLYRRFPGVGYMIHDCSVPSRFFRLYPDLPRLHTDSLKLGRAAEQAGVKCLIPIHFFGEDDFRMEEIEQEIKAHFRGNLIIPDDLDRIDLKRRSKK